MIRLCLDCDKPVSKRAKRCKSHAAKLRDNSAMHSIESLRKLSKHMKNAPYRIDRLGGDEIRWTPEERKRWSTLSKTAPWSIDKVLKNRPDILSANGKRGGRAIAKLAKDPKWRKKRSTKIGKAHAKLWQSKEYRDRNLILSMGKLEKYSYGIREVYVGVKFRSRLEASAARAFDQLGWRWVFESKRIRYWFNQRERTYIIDFYLPDLDWYIEVKPQFKLGDLQLAAKMEGARKAGILLALCTEEDLKLLREDKD